LTDDDDMAMGLSGGGGRDGSSRSRGVDQRQSIESTDSRRATWQPLVDGARGRERRGEERREGGRESDDEEGEEERATTRTVKTRRKAGECRVESHAPCGWLARGIGESQVLAMGKIWRFSIRSG
jgi:hypothetical protein